MNFSASKFFTRLPTHPFEFARRMWAQESNRKVRIAREEGADGRRRGRKQAGRVQHGAVAANGDDEIDLRLPRAVKGRRIRRRRRRRCDIVIGTHGRQRHWLMILVLALILGRSSVSTLLRLLMTQRLIRGHIGQIGSRARFDKGGNAVVAFQIAGDATRPLGGRLVAVAFAAREFTILMNTKIYFQKRNLPVENTTGNQINEAGPTVKQSRRDERT